MTLTSIPSPLLPNGHHRAPATYASGTPPPVRPPRSVPSSAMTTRESVQRMLVHVFLGLVAIQFFLAGLGAFHHNPKPSEKIVETTAFDPQRIGGDIISLVTILIVITAVVKRRQMQLSLGLLVLMIIQHVR